jgi:hypothetical protein
MELALRLLANPVYDALLGEPVSFGQLPAALPELLASTSSVPWRLIISTEPRR